MTIYFNLKDGYLDATSSTQPGHQYSVEVDQDHEVLRNPEVFKYVDGELIKDEERQQQLIEEYEKEQEKLTKEEINEMAILELAGIISELKGES